MAEKTKIKTSIGGQALIEGIMMRGPQKSSICARNTEGEIASEYMTFKSLGEKYPILKWPLIRGVAGMVDSMRLGYSSLMRSAELSGLEEGLDEPESKFEKWLNRVFGDKLFGFIMAVGMVLGVGLAFFLFSWLPPIIFNLMSTYVFTKENAGWLHNDPNIFNLCRAVFIGVLKIVIFVCYILLCTANKDVKRVFQYHGAEHMTIFCYEKGLELNVENVRKQSRFHPRCGTSFMILMLILGIIAGIFITVESATLQALIRVLMLPLVMGVGYELIRFCGKHDNFLVRIISAPGMWMQRITTKVPDDSMIEVGIQALQMVIPEDGTDRI